MGDRWADPGSIDLYVPETCSSLRNAAAWEHTCRIFFIYPLTFIELIDLFVSYAYPFFFISLCIASQTNSDAFNS